MLCSVLDDAINKYEVDDSDKDDDGDVFFDGN